MLLPEMILINPNVLYITIKKRYSPMNNLINIAGLVIFSSLFLLQLYIHTKQRTENGSSKYHSQVYVDAASRKNMILAVFFIALFLVSFFLPSHHKSTGGGPTLVVISLILLFVFIFYKSFDKYHKNK